MSISEINKIVKHQFDRQSQNFSNWSVTRNTEYLAAYSNFCLISPDDVLLDVACGTGEFVIFNAPKISCANGIDISQGMIDLAIKLAAENGLANVNFICSNVENLPYNDHSFSLVICKSAFHHFNQYEKIFNEMTRCCNNGGRISIQDIIAYHDDNVNIFFEELEREIDISHNVTLSKEYVTGLYNQNDIRIMNTFELEIELNFKEYLAHAVQSDESVNKIKSLLEFGLNDKIISQYFIIRNNEIYFKRPVLGILGKK